MLVLGSRNLGPFGRLLLGSVSEGVIRSSRIPVLVARGVGQRWPPEQVVVWDGGSDGAKTARALASRLGDLFGTTSLVLPARPEPAVRSAAKTEVRGSPPTETRLVAGDPVEAILDAVRERERSLVIVGDPGPGTTRRARTGDVPISVLRAYGGPLLICPTRPGVEGEKGEVAPMIRRNERVPTNGTGR
nr:universal stress protein [Rubrobacter marinus]